MNNKELKEKLLYYMQKEIDRLEAEYKELKEENARIRVALIRKKLDIALGIPQNKVLTEQEWNEVKEYCKNDELATDEAMAIIEASVLKK